MAERIEYRGFTIEIEQEVYVDSPREEFDHLGVMCCEHGRYKLGDGGMDLLYDALEADLRWDEVYLNLPEDEEMPEPDDYPALIKLAEAWGYTVLPLYLYDHSGLTMSTAPFSCPWDSGQVGIIFMTPENAHLCSSPENVLKAEVKEYDMFLTGDIWSYRIIDEFGDVVDSLGMIYEYDYAEQEAKAAVDHHIEANGEQLEMEVTT